MGNVFQRACEGRDLDSKPVADYEPFEMAAYVTKLYPGDPIGALKIYRDNCEIGNVLYCVTKTLLEGLKVDKRDEML